MRMLIKYYPSYESIYIFVNNQLMISRYTNEIDVDFVRKSIKAIGRCAIKIESASEKCVDVLMELIKNKSHVNYIVQESIIVVKVKKSSFQSSYFIFRIYSESIHIDTKESSQSFVKTLKCWMNRKVKLHWFGLSVNMRIELTILWNF